MIMFIVVRLHKDLDQQHQTPMVTDSNQAKSPTDLCFLDPSLGYWQRIPHTLHTSCGI